MTQTRIRAETLSGQLLDAWVHKAHGHAARQSLGTWLSVDHDGPVNGLLPSYSTDWGAGGALIGQYGIGLGLPRPDGTVEASIKTSDGMLPTFLTGIGPNALVAAMRVLVMHRCGLHVPVQYPDVAASAGVC